MIKTYFIPFIISMVVSSCSSHSQVIAGNLTPQEKQYCNSLGIDSSIITQLRTKTDSSLQPFPKDVGTIIDADIDIDSIKKFSVGFIFNATYKQSDYIVSSLYDAFQKKGYTIFSLGRSSGIKTNSIIIAIVKSLDKYQILQQVQTNGANHGIDNDSLLAIIKTFDSKYSLQFVGAGFDWCQFNITSEPPDWLAFAKEVYKVCPDVVDQGAETVEKLAEAMKQGKILYFWWD